MMNTATKKGIEFELSNSFEALRTAQPESWVRVALNNRTVVKAVERGVVSALHGSRWAIRDDMVQDMAQEVIVKLLDGSLAKWDPDKAHLLKFVRIVSFRKTLNLIKLHRYHDGNESSKGAVRIDATDATADDEKPACVSVSAEDSDGFKLHTLSVEKRERLSRALARLSDDERALFLHIAAGEAAEGNAVKATRAKNALIAKLARMVAE